MTNKIWFVFLLLLFSCENKNTVDYLFDKMPEERVSEIKQKYVEILTSSPNGWKVYMSSTNDLGRWLILTKFDKNGNVTIQSDPIDYFKTPVAENGVITYTLDFYQSPELIFDSYSQFSVWNEIPVDVDGDGYIDKYAGPETQFIIEKYENEKLYLKSKSDLGSNKAGREISQFVFEKATAADWENMSKIPVVSKLINFTPAKGKYTRFQYKGELLASAFLINAPLRIAEYYGSNGGHSSIIESLPFYIYPEGFSLVFPYYLEGYGEIEHFTVAGDGTIRSTTDADLEIVYTDNAPAVLRAPFSALDKMYLGIELYHDFGDPMGSVIKKLIAALRPPQAAEEQQLNLISFAKNITKDMGKTPFAYPEEITLIFADDKPSYSGSDLYGKNATFVHLPVSFETTKDRMLKISLIGSIEEAFIKAYPNDKAYAMQKAKDLSPLIFELFSEKGWGLYGRDLDTMAPKFDFKDETNPTNNFFTTYLYTQVDVDRAK